jgi:hypothetical protein
MLRAFLILVLFAPAAAQSLLGVRSDTPAGAGGGILRGFNQAWLRHHYGASWTDRFDEAEWERMLRLTSRAGGRVLRVWLFEGFANPAIDWHRAVRAPVAGAAPVLDPRVPANLERVLALAERHGVQLYVTLFTANVAAPADEHRTAEGRTQRNRWWNVIHDKYTSGTHLRANVLAPVLEVLCRHPGAVFGIDLVNEVNAWVKHYWVQDGWTSVARFVRAWRSAIRARCAIPVTASLGHHTAVDDLTDLNLPADAVDFYDFHLYNDSGRIPSAWSVRRVPGRTGRPVILGEFGQEATAVDDDLQARVTAAFLRAARENGLAAAFAWRLSDLSGPERRMKALSYERPDGSMRPAYGTMTRGGP